MLYITIEYQNEMGQFEASSIDANYLLSYWDSEHQPFITAYFKNEDSDGHVLSYQHKVTFVTYIFIISINCLF